MQRHVRILWIGNSITTKVSDAYLENHVLSDPNFEMIKITTRDVVDFRKVLQKKNACTCYNQQNHVRLKVIFNEAVLNRIFPITRESGRLKSVIIQEEVKIAELQT